MTILFKVNSEQNEAKANFVSDVESIKKLFPLNFRKKILTKMKLQVRYFIC